MTTVHNSPLFLLRRTPRRKLFSSSEDDESPLIMSIKSSKSISFNDDHPNSSVIPMIDTHDMVDTSNTNTRSSLSLLESNQILSTRQSKLENFGFEMLPRSTALLKRSHKTRASIIEPNSTKSKKMRTFDVQQVSTSSCHNSKTRFQSSTDSHSDHLVKLFDKTLSTVTPVRDTTNEDNHRYRRGQPLPLILSDSCHEDDLPVLTLNDSDLTSIETKKRAFEHLQSDDLNAGGRSLKRSKIVHDEENKENTFYFPPSISNRIRRGFVRSYSEQQTSNENEEQIKASVELGSNRNLVGDRSRNYLLPRCTSRKHADLACISAETMIDVLRGKYSSEIEQLHVIDCRYPYEYDGGHISIAKNLFTRPQIYEEYFRSAIQSKDPSKRIVFVFHCEFSSERAPSLLRYMRSEDRNIHANNYPSLHYPEIYLLEGGYKAFYEYSTEFCKPNYYRTMLDEQFQDQCRRFRAFSKQAEKFQCSNDEKINIHDDNPSTRSRRTRTSIRSSLSLCFTSSSSTTQIDFS